jgi:HEPN domain-containing protein
LTGVELLQETVERYLKGWLIARGWSLDRTHDLRKLISVAMTIDPAFNRFKSFADELTDDFFAQHYPGGAGQTSARITKLCGSRPVRSSH